MRYVLDVLTCRISGISFSVFRRRSLGSILVSSIVSRKIVLQSASQYLSPVPKQTTKSTKIWLISQSYYCRLPTKLREGNVFSHVCRSISHSVHRWLHMIITHEELDLTVQGHPNPVLFWTWNLVAQGPPPVLSPSGYMWPHCTETPSPSPLLVTSYGHGWRPL